MLQIDIPEVLAELVSAFEAYKSALMANDIQTVNDYFWQCYRRTLVTSEVRRQRLELAI